MSGNGPDLNYGRNFQDWREPLPYDA